MQTLNSRIAPKPWPSSAGSALLECAGVFVGFGLLTLVLFQPTAAELVSTSPAHRGLMADALLYVWAIAHVSRSLFGNLTALFDGPIFYPSGNTLAHSDHMIGQSLLALPLWWITGNPLLVFNVLCLASYPFGATAAYAYVRSLSRGPVAAATAGVVFAFTPFRFRAPCWPQLLMSGLMPLALPFRLRFLHAQPVGAWRLSAV